MALNFTLFNLMAEHFECTLCHGKDAVTRFFSYGHSENACVSCKNCGFTKIYDYHTQDAKYSILK
ncbi:MAG: hypothetical protein HYS07_07135 [Chlamydiae bacterium]|nr:hypothetical protein [Chlamydiota bacterium]MBI3276917.1 hypothetical protein [Chlamydiota bacterium]